MGNEIQIFEEKKVRSHWDEEKEEWYFSVVDVIGILTEQPTHDGARNYWKVLKNRLKEEGAQPVTICNQLKMPAQDGKMRETDVGTTEQIFRIIQSVPSPKAEPFKLWLAKIGKERLDMLADPELSTKQISETTYPQTLNEHSEAAKQGGEVAKNARMELEAKTGRRVISPLNAKQGILPN